MIGERGLSFYSARTDLEGLAGGISSYNICNTLPMVDNMVDNIDILTEELSIVKSELVLREVVIGKQDVKGNNWDERLINKIRGVASKRIEIARMGLNARFYSKTADWFVRLGAGVILSGFFFLPNPLMPLLLKVGCVFWGFARLIKIYQRNIPSTLHNEFKAFNHQLTDVRDELIGAEKNPDLRFSTSS